MIYRWVFSCSQTQFILNLNFQKPIYNLINSFFSDIFTKQKCIVPPKKFSEIIIYFLNLKNYNIMKIKIIFGVMALICSSFLGCNDLKKSPEAEIHEAVKPPIQIISIEEAKSVYDNYTSKRANLIEASEAPLEDGSKFIASRYGDYDIETLKNYIKYVEQQADSAGVKVETLRFYFSTYPDKKEFPDKKKIKHPRQNSFFIVPTIKKDTFNYAFYIKNLGNGKKEAALIRDYPGIMDVKIGDANKTNKSYASMVPNFKASTYQDDESLIMNKTTMGPPPYDPDF